MRIAAASGAASPHRASHCSHHSTSRFARASAHSPHLMRAISRSSSTISGALSDFGGTASVHPKDAAASSYAFSINAGAIDTGNQGRNKHLRSADFFDVEKFPTITFKSKSVKQSGKKNVYEVTGTLTMHGVAKNVTLPVEFLGFQKDPMGNDKAGFSVV